MIGDYSIENNNLFIRLKNEKPTFGFRNRKFDYNLHFCFGIYNKTNKKNIFNIFIECDNKEDLHQYLPRLWISSDINKEYSLVKNIVGKTDFHRKYYFKIHLDGKQTLYIANFPPIMFSRLKETFQDLSEKSKAKELIIGRTVENRCIKAYEYGDINHKPTILFVAGFHPPERDTIAIEAIMERFTNEKWKKEILKDYSFSLIPVLNPDGFANAMQGSNINEINFHWKFFGNSMKECPEVHSIWKYCVKIKPIVFFDFHAFTFQNNNARPYRVPEGYYVTKKARLIQNYFNSKLTELCGNKVHKNAAILAPNLLATRLRNELGTITIPKFHLHMKNGIDGSKQMSLRCLEIVLKGLNRYKVNYSSELLKVPYGNIKTNCFCRLRIKILDFWNLYLKSFLIKMKHRMKN